MYDIKEVTGSTGGECYLFLSEDGAVLLDSGFDFSAGRVVERIREELGGLPLRAVLLTHSHYDHAGGSATVKKAFPDALVCAHPHAARVFASQGAREQMRILNRAAARGAGKSAATDCIDALAVDKQAEDGELLTFGEISVQMLGTPGHTRCSVSWYFPHEGFLYTSETSGVTSPKGEIMPAFIVGYQMALDSIARCAALGAKQVLIPHRGVTDGATSFFAKAKVSAEQMKDLIWSLHRQGADEPAIIREVKEVYYTGDFRVIQPEEAFDVNTQAMVPRLIAELEATETSDL